MSNTPKYQVFVVKDRGKGKKAYFHQIGAAWPTEKGGGLNVKLDSLPITGEFTMMPPMPKEEKPAVEG